MDIYQTKFINIDKEIVIALKQFYIVQLEYDYKDRTLMHA